MHKVKKNWVVKGGVAGAMLVSMVAVPASSMVAQATENEVADATTGEEIGTVASSDPVEEVTQSGNEVVSADVDTTTQQIQPLATDNRDGTTTWIANEDEGVTVLRDSIQRITYPGGPDAPNEYEDWVFDAGLRFQLEIDSSRTSIKSGDKINIPITSDKDGYVGAAGHGAFSEMKGTISGVGSIEYISDDVGFLITVDNDITNSIIVNTELAGEGAQPFQ